MSRLFARVPMGCVALVLALVSTWGCGEPPRKEMDQAQGAIDAARAAGAAEFAPEVLADAQGALARAESSAAERDYRQALHFALDARERAQAAAREAADQKAAARSEAERSVQALDTLLDTADQRITVARTRNLPAAALTPLTGAVAIAREAMQKARTALDEQRYRDAAAVCLEPRAQIQAALEDFESTAAAQPPPRPTRRPR